MEKVKIYEVFNCNKVLFYLFGQQKKFPIPTGFKLFKIMKTFDEVEEYVFNVMETTFDNFDFNTMSKEQESFYNLILSSEIELEYEKISISYFENIDDLTLSIEEINNLSIILTEKK